MMKSGLSHNGYGAVAFCFWSFGLLCACFKCAFEKLEESLGSVGNRLLLLMLILLLLLLLLFGLAIAEIFCNLWPAGPWAIVVPDGQRRLLSTADGPLTFRSVAMTGLWKRCRSRWCSCHCNVLMHLQDIFRFSTKTPRQLWSLWRQPSLHGLLGVHCNEVPLNHDLHLWLCGTNQVLDA